MSFICAHADWHHKGLVGLGGGMAYGLTTALVNIPLHAIKRNMQVLLQMGRFQGTINAFGTIVKTCEQQRLYGFYKGSFLGSVMYRSSQFAVYVSVYEYMNGSIGEAELFGGLKVRVLVGGLASGVTGALLETPIDYWDIHRPVRKDWRCKDHHMYRRMIFLRSSLLMSLYFSYLDLARQYSSYFLDSDMFSTTVSGKFFINGTAVTAAWLTVWPLELIKSQERSGVESQTLFQRMKGIVKEKGGFLALYKGIGPNLIQSFFANGISMIVMMKTIESLTPLIW